MPGRRRKRRSVGQQLGEPRYLRAVAATDRATATAVSFDNEAKAQGILQRVEDTLQFLEQGRSLREMTSRSENVERRPGELME